MIFSGMVGTYKCKACAAEFSNAVPTSLLPMIAVVAVTTPLWHYVLRQWIPVWWISVPAGAGVSFATLLILSFLIDLVIARKFRRGICPKCGGVLERTSAGFYDGFVPTLRELFVYGLVVLTAVAVLVLDKR